MKAPPTLPFYLHRLPAKSLEEIYGETLPRPNGKGWGDYKNKLPALAEELQKKTAVEVLLEIDHLLELAHFDANASAELFNLLHDLHDAFSVAAPRGEAQLLAGARVLEDILGVRGTTPIDPRPAKK